MTRKKVKTAPRRRGGKLMGPSWDGWEKLDGASFSRLQRHATDFYYQEYKPADLYPYFYEWMKNNGYDKKSVDAAKRASIQPTYGIYARILADGAPDYNPVYDEYWQSLAGTMGVVKPISETLVAPQLSSLI